MLLDIVAIRASAVTLDLADTLVLQILEQVATLDTLELVVILV